MTDANARACSESRTDTSDSVDIVSEGLLTVLQAATFLSVSRSKLYEMMDSGELCYVKVGRCRRVPRRAAVELAARCLHGEHEAGR